MSSEFWFEILWGTWFGVAGIWISILAMKKASNAEENSDIATKTMFLCLYELKKFKKAYKQELKYFKTFNDKSWDLQDPDKLYPNKEILGEFQNTCYNKILKAKGFFQDHIEYVEQLMLSNNKHNIKTAHREWKKIRSCLINYIEIINGVADKLDRFSYEFKHGTQIKTKKDKGYKLSNKPLSKEELNILKVNFTNIIKSYNFKILVRKRSRVILGIGNGPLDLKNNSPWRDLVHYDDWEIENVYENRRRWYE